MLRKIFFLIIILTFFSFPSDIYGATYYVTPSGNNDNPGSQSQPWETIQKANQEAKTGDIIVIQPGQYKERILPTQSGITYRGGGSDNTRVVIQGQSGVYPTVNFMGKNNLVLENLTINYEYPTPGKGTWIQVSGTNNKIRNNRIIRNTPTFSKSDPREAMIHRYAHEYKESAITISGNSSSQNEVTNNFISGLNFGVHIKDSGKGHIVRGNTFTILGQSSIVLGTSHGVLRGALIENNLFEGSVIEDGIQFHQDFDAARPGEDTSNRGTIIRNNIFRTNGENSIDLKGASHNVIEGNLFTKTIGSNNGALEGYFPDDNQQTCQSDDVKGVAVDPALPVYSSRNNNGPPCWNRVSSGTISRGANASSGTVIIRNNIFYDNIAMTVIDGPNWKIYNNTVLGNNTDFTGSNSTYNGSTKFSSFRQYEAIYTNASVLNNLVGGHKQAEAEIGTNSDIEINGNAYWDPNGITFSIPGNRSASFAQWQAKGFDPQGQIITDAKLSDITNPRPTGLNLTKNMFAPQGSSPLVDQGIYLTKTTNSGDSATNLIVADAYFFTDGYGITSGDQIRIGTGSTAKLATIRTVNLPNTLILTQPTSWRANDPVNLNYNGNKPDVGAIEFNGASSGITPTPTPAISFKQLLSQWFTSSSDQNSDNIFNMFDWLFKL